MKTLREYIDLIKEAEHPDWKAIITKEVNARGLPHKVTAGAGYNYAHISTFKSNPDIEVLVFEYGKAAVSVVSPDGVDYVAPWRQGGKVEPGYSNLDELISVIEISCKNSVLENDNAYPDWQNQRGQGYTEVEINPSYGKDGESANRALATAAKKAGYDNVDGFITDNFSNDNYFEYGGLDDTETMLDPFKNHAEVRWGSELTIELSGPDIEIDKVEGKLTSGSAEDLYQQLINDPKIKADLSDRTETSKQLANREIINKAKNLSAEKITTISSRDIIDILNKLKSIAAAKE